MKRTYLTFVSVVRSSAIILAVASMSFSAHAQSGVAQTPSGPAPRAADGHPDLSGVWWPGADLPVQGLKLSAGAEFAAPAVPRPGSFQSLYTPEALAKWKSLSDKDDPALRCVPSVFSMRNVSLYGTGIVGQIVQTPKFLVLLTETYHGFKIVPTDGRPHSEDAPPSYRGESVGRWDGDTFVMDTKNFTDDTWIYAEGTVSFHSDALHVVERYRRVDANTLQVDATLEDSKVLIAPYTIPTQTLRLAPFDRIFEVSCTSVVSGLMDAAAKENYGNYGRKK